MSLVRALAGGLARPGLEVRFANVYDPAHQAEMNAMAPDAFDLVIGVGVWTLQTWFGDRPLYRHFQCPFLFWVLDPIIYDLQRVPSAGVYLQASRQDDRLGWLFPDRSYMELAAALGARNVRYFPYGAGVLGADGRPWPEGPDPAQRRGVLVLGHLGEELTGHGGQSVGEILAAMDTFGLSDARRTALASQVMEESPLANVAWTVRNALALEPAALLRPEVLALLTAIDSSEKRRRRMAAIDSAGDVPMNIVGSGWRRYLGERPHITFSETLVRHEDLFQLFSRYRVLFDFSPNWDHGFNDRVATALGAGCRVVTTRNGAVAELGAAADFISVYSPHRPEAEPLLIQALAPGPAMPAKVRDELSWSRAATRLF
jgi:hypothetical protein